MEREKVAPTAKTPYQWIKESIIDLLRPEDDDSDSDDEEPLPSDPLTSLTSLKISRDKVRKAFRLWKESTSTSPSGRYLGHYKSLVGDDDFADYLIH